LNLEINYSIVYVDNTHSLFYYLQRRAEVWWGPRRPLDCMPLYQILVLSSDVWWSLLLVIGCCDVTMRRHIHVCKPTFWRSLLTQLAYYFTRTLLTRCCTMCRCNVHELSALQVRRPEQNTALNAKTKQFITAKISVNVLKQVSRTHSVLRQSSA